MIELAELTRQIDDIITAHNGVSEGGSILFGDVNYHFHNGWRRGIYDIKKTIEGGKPHDRNTQIPRTE